MNRLIEKTVFCGICHRLPLGEQPHEVLTVLEADYDGVVLPPSGFGMITGSPPSMTATHEFVVPRSIPIIFDISHHSFRKLFPLLLTSYRIHQYPCHNRAGMTVMYLIINEWVTKANPEDWISGDFKGDRQT